jgi:hypothetical protein
MTIVGLLAPMAANAATPDIATAVKTLASIEADAGKLASYCTIVAKMIAAGADQAQTDALGEEMDSLIRSFGPEFESALDLHLDLDDASPEGQATIAAFEALDQRCAK